MINMLIVSAVITIIAFVIQVGFMVICVLENWDVTWDNMPYPAFTIKDVDDGVVEYFKKLAENTVLTGIFLLSHILLLIGINR